MKWIFKAFILKHKLSFSWQLPTHVSSSRQSLSESIVGSDGDGSLAGVSSLVEPLLTAAAHWSPVSRLLVLWTGYRG